MGKLLESENFLQDHFTFLGAYPANSHLHDGVKAPLWRVQVS